MKKWKNKKLKKWNQIAKSKNKTKHRHHDNFQFFIQSDFFSSRDLAKIIMLSAERSGIILHLDWFYQNHSDYLLE
jgi:hypothetical protein